MLKSTLQEIIRSYSQARKEPFKDHDVAKLVRTNAANALASILGPEFSSIAVEGSPGKGQWAAIPWIALFDPVVTDSATKGYYLVYLFAEDMSGVYLSLNQGTTSVREEFKSQTTDELLRRSETMCARLGVLPEHLGRASIDLKATGNLARDYEAGHAFGCYYPANAIPDDKTLIDDVEQMLRLYLLLTAKGGLTGTEDLEAGEEETGTLTEKRQYRYHRRVERNQTLSLKAKKELGATCQACDISMIDTYGPLGDGYIEAHHLVPISELPEGQAVPHDPKKDFAVLCPNCHRMIHRMDDSSDVAGLRQLIESARAD